MPRTHVSLLGATGACHINVIEPSNLRLYFWAASAKGSGRGTADRNSGSGAGEDGDGGAQLVRGLVCLLEQRVELGVQLLDLALRLAVRGAPAALFAPRCGGPRARFFWCHGGRAEPAVHRLLWCRKDAAARRCCCVSGQLSPSPAAPRGCCSLRSSRLGWLELYRSVLSFLRAALLRYGLLVLSRAAFTRLP